MQVYGLGYRELLELPINTFWMLNRNADRIRAQSDLHNFSISLTAGATNAESVNRFRDQLVLELDEPWKYDSLEEELDRAGLNRLRAMMR